MINGQMKWAVNFRFFGERFHRLIIVKVSMLSLHHYECVPIRCCVPMCPVSGSGVAQGAVMGLSPPGGEFSEVQHLARRRWRHRPRRNPRPAPLLMAHFRPSLVITQYLHCAAHKPQVTCVLLLVSTTHIYLEPNQLTFHISKFHD